MNQNYLVTYDIPVPYEGVSVLSLFAWFESEDDLIEFYKSMKNKYGKQFKVIDAIHVIDSQEINL